MGMSVGEIDLGLSINPQQFNNQLSHAAREATNRVNNTFSNMSNRIGSTFTGTADRIGSVFSGMASKIGVVLGAVAFGNFAKECLELGSDLTEVQNVVDVTFGKMSEEINNWSKNAMEKFGLSETVAKRYAGTAGAMAKAFGITGQAGVKMSEEVAGLSADVASFYNISTDEAFTKLKSIFTGETESLKDLGVVMTQTALDQYALNNGFGKTTKEMSEQEKVMLRYQFVMSRLSGAKGDFERTSDSWANQTRVLKLRIDALKASIGQGLINLFTPVLKGINTVIARFSVLGEYFKKFTEWLTGKKSESSGAITDAATDLASSTEDMSNASDKVAQNTDKAKEKAKELKRELMGFDKINKLSKDSDDNSNNTNNSGSGASGLGDLGALNTAISQMDQNTSSLVNNLTDKIKSVFDLFKQGFAEGFYGNLKDRLNSIKDHAIGIKNSLKDIFTSDEVVSSAKIFAESVITNFGKITGATLSIGVTIAENLLGGLDKYLKENSQYLKDKISSIFTINAETLNIAGDFAVAVADIFDVFSGDSATSITASIIGIFSTAALNVTEICSKLGRDLLNLLTKPFIDNKDALKEALENILKAYAIHFKTLEQAVKDVCDGIQKLYDNHIKPWIDAIADTFSEWAGTFLDVYNKHVAPILEKLANKFREVYEQHIKPVIDKLVDVLSPFFDTMKFFWESILKPLGNWLIETLIPPLADFFGFLGDTVLDTIGSLFDVLGGILDVIGDVAEGAKNFTIGLWTKLGDGFDAVKDTWDSLKDVSVTKTLKAAKDKAFELGEKAWDAIKDSAVAKTLKAAKDRMFDEVKTAWEGIKNGDAKKVLNAVKHKLFDKVSGAFDKLKNSDAVKTIKGKTNRAFTNVKNAFNKLKNSDAVKSIKAKSTSAFNTVKKTWDSLKDKAINLKGKLNIDTIKSAIKTIINWINTYIIGSINKIHVTIPSWVPKMGGKGFGFNIPKIKGFAQGGWIAPNMPQLVMVGDNKQEGEIIAPESKLYKMAQQASSNGNRATEQLLREIVQVIKNMDLTLDGDKITKKVVSNINRNTRITGVCEVIV